MDEKLAAGDDKSALLLIKDLQGKNGGFPYFGAAQQVETDILNEEIVEAEEDWDGKVSLLDGGESINIVLLPSVLFSIPFCCCCISFFKNDWSGCGRILNIFSLLLLNLSWS